jgi:predicted dithiol-disulfide oxidoreductase (DUF899 family)
MALPEVVSPEQWLEARRTLLNREKEMTRAHDALNADRRRLPMVRIEKDYAFEGPDGAVRLLDLFAGKPQLIVQHVMFGPDWDEVCPGCTGSIEEQSQGLLSHLGSRGTNFVLVSRAPYEKIAAKKAEHGWSTPWYSSHGSDFNYDFHVSLDSDVAPIQYNFRDADELRQAGTEWLLEKPSEQPGFSCFLRDGETVYHTYSTFARGSEYLGGAYTMLDLTALGRQEEWEEPKGRVEKPGPSVPFFTS